MEDALQQATRLVRQLQYKYDSVVSQRSSGEDFQNELGQLANQCDRLDILLNKEPAVRRTACKSHVDQVRFDYQSLSKNFDGYRRRLAAEESETREREQLMARTFTRNSDHTSILLDGALRENTSLSSSSQSLDGILGQGRSILSNLQGQRSVMKNAHRKMHDVMTSLGLSNTVMRLIERRSSQDKLIMFGGMIATLLFMFFFYRWYHS